MKNITLKKPKQSKGIRNGLFTLLSIAFGLAATAQTTITVGTGTNNSASAPIAGYYGYSYSQNIYYASDLIAAGASAGTISKIRFFYSGGGDGANSNNWTVYMGHTNKTSFTSNSNWVPTSGLTNSFSGTFTMPSAGNWAEITLTTPFQWNGIDNLLIAVDENQGSYASDVMNWSATTVTGNRSIYFFNDYTNPNPASPPGANSTSNVLPNLQIEWLEAPACTMAPAHVNATVNDGSICPGDQVTFGISSYEFVSGLTYQWQSNSGSGWADISGATSVNYSTNSITETANYRNVLTCAAASLSDTSEDISVIFNPLPTLTISDNDVAICSGEPAEIIVSGADTYLWSPTTAVSPSATQDTVYILPTATTIYTVTGTTAGCSSTITTTITPISMVSPSASYNSTENCTPGSAITQTITGLPDTISNGGEWEYRWLASNGLTVLQDWSASNTYTFTPAADSVYGSFYQVRSTSCQDNQIDSIYTEIVIGFGADVAVTDFNCNSEGILTLSNTFGQKPTADTLYTNPMNDIATMTDFALTGNASVTGGRLQLTPSAGSQTGYAVLTTPGLDPGINNSMNVSFKLTADTPLNIYGTGGGDGVAYSFGDDAVPASAGSGHNGKGTKLRLSFDAADNSGENGNARGIYLVWGWNSATAYGPNTSQVLHYSNNTAWKLGTDVQVDFSIDADGKASLVVGGTSIFSGIQLPAAYMNADVSNWKHLFSAATGGDALRQAVSDLKITKGNMQYGITAGGSATPPSTWQEGKTFSDLEPGTYDIWISKDQTGTCMKNIGTYEILNTNPVVNLGNDTTICDSEVLLLDAGNAGSTYVWSGSNNYSQTMEVSEAGSYICYVTDTVGCLGIGTINVDVNEAPSATSIYSQGSFPMMNFSVVGAQNADTYDWNFGDGNSIMNAPASVSHMYTNDGTFTVTVTLSNDCGTDVETTSITIIDYTGIDENSIVNLDVYPNPASSQITVSVPNSETSEVTIYSISGSLVQATTPFNDKATIDVSNWESGIYFMNVTNQGKRSVTKFVVE